jgi:protein-S-isoprenylcysteine O-methyltransferase Ste14
MKRRDIRATVVAAIFGAMAGARLAGPLSDRVRPVMHTPEVRRIAVAIAMWLAFSIYWTIAARNSAATDHSESRSSTAFHQGMMALAQLLVFLPIIPGLRAAFLPETFWLAIIGGAVMAASIALAAWARVHLGRNWSAEVRIAQGHKLVRTGPYARIRHPIYTAVLGMFVGAAICSGHTHALAGLLLMAALYWRKIRLEEKILAETFGAEFEKYRRGTWALVPLVI